MTARLTGLTGTPQPTAYSLPRDGHTLSLIHI